jgi:ankyrin repeat protein
MAAVRAGELEGWIKFLIENCSEDVNYCNNEFEWTALSWAIERDRIDICRLLLDHGADVNHKSNSGLTPLMVAVYNWKIDIIYLLLINGANVNQKNNQGLTAFDFNLRFGDDIKIQNILLWRGAKCSQHRQIKDIEILLLIYCKVLQIDLLREIHTKWLS